MNPHLSNFLFTAGPGRRTLNVGCWLSNVGRVLSLSLLLSGCLSPRPAGDAPPSADVAVIGVQYAVSTGAGTGYNTVEIFLSNPGRREVRFTGGTLDGQDLPSLNSGALASLASQFSIHLDGAATPVALPLPPPDKQVTWWQFYPSYVVAPGEAICCQINLSGSSSAARQLELRRENGPPIMLTIPRFSQPPERITAVTWSLDGKRIHVQYAANGSALESLKINNRAIKPSAILRAAHPGLPEVAVLPAPGGRAFGRGDPVLVELTFAGGARRRALVRAFTGIMLDAPRGWETDKTLPAAVREAYTLDADPAIAYLPFDVACGDTRAERPGAAAPVVAAARHKAWRGRPDRLYGVEICTARYAAIWNIYAPLADALIVKPYQLHWGPDSARFIENEEALVATAVAAAAPRPAVWVPERFKRERHVEGAELRVLAWTAIARGIKGIRYHYWMNGPDAPFRECPDLGEAMKAVNADIKRIEPILGPLIPVEVRTDRSQRIKVYEGWSGDAGVLLLVRNMDYRTDARADDDGRSPRFHAQPASDIALSLDLPPWLAPAHPTEPLSGETYPHTRGEGSLAITIPTLDDIRLVWLENRGRATARGNERSTP